jgi:hypothetical protein
MIRSSYLSTLCLSAAASLAACSSGNTATEGSIRASVGTTAEAIDARNTCQLASPTGALKRVVYVQFDNLHLSRDIASVPSDLEQMPNLLSFMKGEGTVLSKHHTPLISHTANDIVTALTGLYPDRQGLAVANSYRTFNATTGKSQSASDFTYWTDPVSSSDPSYNLVGPDGKNAPAPWAAYTRAGCDFGAVSTANMELENTSGDVTTVFGATSPQALEAKTSPAKATADLVGIAIHCAAGSTICTGDNARADVLPDEPGGYTGFQALFGHAAVAPRISSAPLLDLDGNVIADANGNVGFPGFDGMSATRSLGYVATMLEAGLPVVYAYISDAHDNHSGGNAFGPGEAGYVAQLKAYDAAFGKFFARLAKDGIDSTNTLFVFTADEGDHFVGGAPSPAGCDGVTVPCTYTQIGELNGNVSGLLAAEGVTTPFSIAQSLGVYVNGNPGAADPTTRTLERAFGGLSGVNPMTNASESVSAFLADRTEMGLLHMITGDPLRTPTFTTFVNPNWYIYTGAPSCTTQSPCVQQEPGYAWNHGMVSKDVNVTWLGVAGPGVRHEGITSEIWSDHADVRPTILALAGLSDDYVHEGRALFELFHHRAVPRALDAEDADIQRLARVFKQINAPVGELGMMSLHLADYAAKSGSATDDSAFTATSAAIASITTRRDALVAQMEAALDGATFHGTAIARHDARRMADEGEFLVAEMAFLSFGK